MTRMTTTSPSVVEIVGLELAGLVAAEEVRYSVVAESVDQEPGEHIAADYVADEMNRHVHSRNRNVLSAIDVAAAAAAAAKATEAVEAEHVSLG